MNTLMSTIKAFRIEHKDSKLGPFHHKDPDAVYYETHFEFETKNPIQEYNVKNFCQYSNTYFSYNVNKCEGDNKVIMLTIRDKKISQEDYFKKVESITSDMKKALLPLIKVQSEFAVFDSNPEHDNPWLS